MKLRQNMLDALQFRNRGPFVPTCELAFFQLDKFCTDPHPADLERLEELEGVARKRLLRHYCRNIAEGLERLEHGMICVWHGDLSMEICETLAELSEGRFAVGLYMDGTLGIPEGSELLQLLAGHGGGSWCKVSCESSVYYSRQPGA